jgi:hypothetical protein
MSRGHGGLYCSACHGEPHAILPSGQANDNVQNIALQGHAGTLNKCEVCHGVVPAGPGPHGLVSLPCCVVPGDANHDGRVNVGDVAFNVLFIFKGGKPADCKGEADANGDSKVNVGDAVYVINYIFKSGSAPVCGPAQLVQAK